MQIPKFALPISLLALVALPAIPAQEPAEPTTIKQVISCIRSAGSAKQWRGSDNLVVWDFTRNRIEDSGLGHTETHKIIKVLTRSGGAALATQRFDYDPASNMVEVKLARIIRRDGRIEEIPPKAILDLPQPQSMIIWGPRMKLVTFGRLQPGDAIEYQLYQKGFMIAYLQGQDKADDDARFIPPMRGHFYDTVVFAGALPIVCKYYQLLLPRNKPLRYKVYNGDVASACDYTEKHLTYGFWRRNVPAHKHEVRTVADSDHCPKVVMATTKTWQEKSRWFWKVQEEREIFANKPRTDGLPGGEAEVAEMKAIVDKLCTGKTREEKIQALNHWSADKIRYMGITMGKGEGYTIHPGVMNLHDRCGVCKDKAGMLTSLLRLAGFEAYCGMTMAGSRVEDIPADQFNHCITAVREPDGSLRVLDPTWIPLSMEMWSSAESEQNYLIGTEKGEPLMITPLPPPEHNRLFVEAESQISKTGQLTTNVEVYGKNYADQRIRRHFYDVPQRTVGAAFSAWAWAIAPGSEVKSIRYNPDAMTDYTAPATVGFKALAQGYADRGEKTLAFVPVITKPFLGNRHIPFLGIPLTANRTQDLLLWCNRSLKLREKISLPAGWRVKRLPAPIKLDGPAMRLSWSITPKDNGSTLDCELEVALKLRTVPVKDFAQFKQVVQAYLALAKNPVILTAN